MATVLQIVQRLFPEGTRADLPNDWKQHPLWPPDLFAACATLATLSGCYAQPRFTASQAPRFVFDDDYRDRVVTAGKTWSHTGTAPKALQSLWSVLLKAGSATVGPDAVGTRVDWPNAIMEMLAIADEACEGIGFNSEDNRIALVVLAEHLHHVRHTRGMLLPYVPHSLCMMVPPTEASVQPKTLAPQVGCTVRSFSNHVALLPPSGVVSTSWRIGDWNDANVNDGREHDPSEHLNLLVIPFPFTLDRQAFVRREEESRSTRTLESHHFFDVNQYWLSPGGKPLTAAALCNELINPLIVEARKEFGAIGGVILPELALTQSLADEVARHLARGRKNPDLELFVSGVLVPPRSRNGIAVNAAATYLFHEGNLVTSWVQRKHHRWCLNEGQVRRYQLGHVFPPKRRFWWERIDVSLRECHFYTVRSAVSIAVLICEDLARFDPVQPALLAVGPNLVISLLMDGPQMDSRWPSRYATVLADDPGSAVLTLTSLGMVRRSTEPASPHAGKIAMWKHYDGKVQELSLPAACSAMVLSLAVHQDEQMTLDGRSDGGSARRLELAEWRGVKLEKAPDWAKLPD